MKPFPLLFLTFVSTACFSMAEELIDPAALGFGGPAYTLDVTSQGAMDYKSGNGSFDSIELRALAPLAKWESGNLLLGLGLEYTGMQVDFGDRLGVGEKDLHELHLRLFAGYRDKTSPWWAMGFLSPGIASDFEHISSDAFTSMGLGLAGYKLNPTLDLAGGVFSSFNMAQTLILPAFGFIWKPSKEWVVQATPPIVALGWKPCPEWTVGLVSYPAGSVWEVGAGTDRVKQIDVSAWRAALSVERKIGSHWRINLRAGITFGGEIEFRDGQERVIEDADLDAAPFAAIAAKWAF